MNWFAARDYCLHARADGSSILASVRTGSQNDFIRSELAGVPGLKFWIAANDLTVEGAWEWDIGTGDLVVYSNWSNSTDPPQPDDGVAGTGNGSEDCATMDGDDVSFWYDEDCEGALFEPLCMYYP